MRELAAGSSPRVATSIVLMMGHQSQHSPLNCGILNGIASSSKLIDVLQHNDSGLHGHAEQRQETDTGRNAKIGAGDQKRQQAPDACHSHVGQNSDAHLKDLNIV